MAKRAKQPGGAELEVLQALWELGPSTVRDVLSHLHERGRTIAYTTVLTFLTRLEQKGQVLADKRGQAYVYRAKVSRKRVAKERINSIVDQLYDGAPGALVLQLMESQRFSPEEIEQFRMLIDRLAQQEPGGAA
ncbi:MAG: BlaI/MecI/CopY family transcriptional regulator [Phycisphaerales bacterium]|nr:BlaI/MecI/CopY family transcriptional regulator [Phycisphaerales bacterium]